MISLRYNKGRGYVGSDPGVEEKVGARTVEGGALGDRAHVGVVAVVPFLGCYVLDFSRESELGSTYAV